MTFIEPAWLWGALAVVIPIAIHFWHQKRGKPLPWAATQWLTEARQQQQRGLKFDNWLLLLLRCLLLVLLAILLARPLLNRLKTATSVRPVHLVQANPAVVSNFRFELEEALRRGDEVRWIGRDEAVKTLLPVPAESPLTPLLLQTAIDQRGGADVALHLYLLNSQRLATVPAIYVPGRFQVHTTTTTASEPQPYLTGRDGRKLFLNEAGRLTSTPTTTVRLATHPVQNGPIRVLTDYRNPVERQTVRAALNALSDVYGFVFQIDDRAASDATYAWILTDKPVRRPLVQTLYVVSGSELQPEAPNVVTVANPLLPQTNERVAAGQLPEWLGERLLRHYGLLDKAQPLSQRAFNALFVAEARTDPKPQTLVQSVLLLLFILLFMAERWVALTKNA